LVSGPGRIDSAIVLLINEVAQFLRERYEFSQWAGEYEREKWFEKLEKNKRAEDLTEEEKNRLLQSQ
jgi:hypothetical protein